MAICSRPVPQLVAALVSPIMWGGTPKARAMSTTWNLRASSSWASSALTLIVSCLMPSVSTSGSLWALLTPLYLAAKASRRLSICSCFICFSVCSTMDGCAPPAKNLPLYSSMAMALPVALRAAYWITLMALRPSKPKPGKCSMSSWSAPQRLTSSMLYCTRLPSSVR